MSTDYKITPSESSHWYCHDGTPRYEVKAKDGHLRPATLADARKLHLLPSPTGIIGGTLAKPGLVNWQIMEGIKAVVTAPDLPGEMLDGKIKRVLDAKEHEEESAFARDLGTDTHTLIAHDLCWAGKEPIQEAAFPIAKAACDWLAAQGFQTKHKELSVAKKELGYGGKIDRVVENTRRVLVDFKTAKKLPDRGAWFDHLIQTGAYAQLMPEIDQTCVVYLSTTEPGKLSFFFRTDWQQDAETFNHLFAVWRAMKDFDPRVSDAVTLEKIEAVGL